MGRKINAHIYTLVKPLAMGFTGIGLAFNSI
jgi:hypothetical protein